MIHRIDVAVTPVGVAIGLRGIAVVVIDVLRATTTIVRALEAGAAAVIPVLEPEDATAVRSRIGRDRVLLGGERDAQKIIGFDLDNSPASYTPEVVANKTIAFTTSNGTRALQRVGHSGAATVLCAALVNRNAVVKALENTHATEGLLVCAGQDGAFSFEDFLCAGAIASAFLERRPEAELSDAARAAAVMFRGASPRLADAVASGTHAQMLADKGFGEDILACADIDTSEFVPIYRDGEIT